MHSRKSNSLAGALKLSASALAAAVAIAVPVAGNAATDSANVRVSAQVNSQCRITAPSTDLGFGTVDVLSTGIQTAQLGIQVTCNKGATVSLLGANGTNPVGTQKRMSNGTDFLNYTMKAPTGANFDSCASATQSLDGSYAGLPVSSLWSTSGGPRTIQLCGELDRAQPNAGAGAYTDTVVVTISY